MFLVFQTTDGELTVNADTVVSYRHDSTRELTELCTVDGSCYAVLEHPVMIRKALETHTCVIDVLHLHVTPQLEENGIDVQEIDVTAHNDPGPRTLIQVKVDGKPVASWETSEDGQHHPTS